MPKTAWESTWFGAISLYLDCPANPTPQHTTEHPVSHDIAGFMVYGRCADKGSRTACIAL